MLFILFGNHLSVHNLETLFACMTRSFANYHTVLTYVYVSPVKHDKFMNYQMFTI